MINTPLTKELKIERGSLPSKQAHVQGHHGLETTRDDPHNPHSVFKLLHMVHNSPHTQNIDQSISVIEAAIYMNIYKYT